MGPSSSTDRRCWVSQSPRWAGARGTRAARPRCAAGAPAPCCAAAACGDGASCLPATAAATPAAASWCLLGREVGCQAPVEAELCSPRAEHWQRQLLCAQHRDVRPPPEERALRPLAVCADGLLVRACMQPAARLPDQGGSSGPLHFPSPAPPCHQHCQALLSVPSAATAAAARRSPSNRNLEAVGHGALKFTAQPSLLNALPLAWQALKG